VSDRVLALLQLSSSKKKPRVLAYSRITLVAGIIENGEILDQKAFAKAIKKLVSEATPQPPKTTRVSMSLPEAVTFMEHFVVPIAFEGEHLDEEVIRQAEMIMPLNLDEYAWDYQPLYKGPDVQEVLFAAASKAVVEAYAHTVTLAGLELVMLEPESLSLVRALGSSQKTDEKTGIAVIDMGGRATHVLLSDDHGLWLSVSYPEGGISITQAIMEKKKLTEKAAELLKKNKGLSDASVKDIIQAYVENFGKEFEKASTYYTKRTGRQIKLALITGGASLLEGLREQLATKIGIPVKQAQLAVDIKEISPAHSAVVFGLAVRPRKKQKQFSFVMPD